MIQRHPHPSHHLNIQDGNPQSTTRMVQVKTDTTMTTVEVTLATILMTLKKVHKPGLMMTLATSVKSSRNLILKLKLLMMISPLHRLYLLHNPIQYRLTHS